MAVVGSLFVVLAGNNAPLLASLAQSQSAMRGFSGTASTALSAVRTAAVATGAGVALGLGLGVKAAADFEDAFAGVRKTVDDADLAAAGLSFDDLATSFRTMATEIPIAATELAGIGEAAGALGIKAGDIESFTRTVALLGVTTDLTTDAAATSLGKIGTILGLTGKDFAAFGDILVALGNNGASTESEIIDVATRFAAAGKQAGLSTAEILAFSSAITSAGVEPEAAGSSLSRLFGNLILDTANATSKGKAFAEITGRSFRNFSQLVKTDTVGAMTQFLEKLGGLDKFTQARALKSVGITNVRDVNAIRLLADTYEQNLIPAIATANNATGALSTEAQKKFDTFNSKITLLGNAFNELFISVGTPLLPPLTAFVQSLTADIASVGSSIGSWVASGQQLASQFAPVITGIVAKFQELVPVVQDVGATILDLATRVWEGGLNKALAVGATLIGSVIDVIGDIATAILENEDAMNILRTAADLIGAGFGIAATAVGNLLTFLGNLGDSIRNNEELMAGLAWAGNAIGRAFENAAPAVQMIIDLIAKAAEFAGLVADEILRLAGGKGPAIKDMRNPDRNEGEPIDVALREWDPSNPDTDPIFGDFNRLIGGIGDHLFRGGKSPMEFATGGVVPGSGPQLIVAHGGETITPAGRQSTGGVVHRHIHIEIGGKPLVEYIERELFNDANQFTSGFAPASAGG